MGGKSVKKAWDATSIEAAIKKLQGSSNKSTKVSDQTKTKKKPTKTLGDAFN